MYTYTQRMIAFAGLLLALASLTGCAALQSPPVAPSQLQLSRPASDRIVLSWNNNAPAATGIRVERSCTANTAWTPQADLPVSARTWTDTDIAFNNTYAYRVVVASPGGSAASSAVEITITDLAGTPAPSPSASPSPAPSPSPTPVVSNWNLTGWHKAWGDEFDGSGLDTASWTIETGTGPHSDGWGNNELEYYRAENLGFTNDGGRSVLDITAKRESYGGRAYTSARIKTAAKRSFTYGRIEACMKLPMGNGIWPAFWMLGSSIGNLGWPQCGEIDIMEMVGGSGGTLSDSTTYGTIHYANAANQWRYVSAGSSLASGKFADGYHLFGVEWDAGSIKWFLDGAKFTEQQIGDAERTEFQSSFFILFNLAVGGNWPGSPTASTVFPQHMMIDWVRVYQKD